MANPTGKSPSQSIVMIGSTGAVGTHALMGLVELDEVDKITLLVRSPSPVKSDKITQHIVDVLKPETYQMHLDGHDVGISTFGVGEPSKISKADFLKIDKDAVLTFATHCRNAGIDHFQSLGSVGVDSKSSQYYLKAKGELEEGISALGFSRVSLFHPSMILTPINRYGVSQGLTLALWPLLTPILVGPLRKLRGIKVDRLGRAMANNLLKSGRGVEILEWDEFEALNSVSFDHSPLSAAVRPYK